MENVWFLDSPDFEILPDFRTGRDVRYSPKFASYVKYGWPLPPIIMRRKKKSLGGKLCQQSMHLSMGDGEKAYSRRDNMPFRTSLQFLIHYGRIFPIVSKKYEAFQPAKLLKIRFKYIKFYQNFSSYHFHPPKRLLLMC